MNARILFLSTFFQESETIFSFISFRQIERGGGKKEKNPTNSFIKRSINPKDIISYYVDIFICNILTITNLISPFLSIACIYATYFQIFYKESTTIFNFYFAPLNIIKTTKYFPSTPSLGTKERKNMSNLPFSFLHISQAIQFLFTKEWDRKIIRKNILII